MPGDLLRFCLVLSLLRLLFLLLFSFLCLDFLPLLPLCLLLRFLSLSDPLSSEDGSLAWALTAAACSIARFCRAARH